ncbi:MAG: hypothetical protein PHH98_05680 [Candidatus Gracilibacteria bacterium]|nr:hypothetical protein [Candidatus Gracilibacteria bacterium]
MNFDIKYLFLICSAIFTFFSYFIYFRSIVKGETKPHVVSWFIWGLISLIIFVIQIYDDAGLGAFNTGLVSFFCLGIAFISFKKGDKKISKSDGYSLVFGILSIVLWIFTNNPILSVVLLILVDLFGFIPTILKSINKPFEESETAYFLAFLGYFMSTFAMNHISFLSSGFIIFTCISNLILALLIFIRKRELKVVNIKNKPI